MTSFLQDKQLTIALTGEIDHHSARQIIEQLGEKIGDNCELNGREVSEAEFDAWYAANMTSDVTWYSPDGAVIPENM